MTIIKPKDEKLVQKIFDRLFERGLRTNKKMTTIGHKILRIAWIIFVVLTLGVIVYLSGLFRKEKI
jgi:hypothetical protein